MTLRALLLAGLLAAAPLPPALAGTTTAEAVLEEELRRRYGEALGGGELRLMLTAPVEGAVRGVQTVSYDPRSGRFAAILVRERDRVRVEGQAWTETEITVPARRLNPGDVIAPGDLTTLTLRSDQLGGRALTSRAELEGMQVRRVLAAGRPVPSGNVIAPIIVQRAKPVTVEFRSGGLALSAKGRALEDGGLGDVIRVQNLDSNRTITAVVRGPGLVSASD